MSRGAFRCIFRSTRSNGGHTPSTACNGARISSSPNISAACHTAMKTVTSSDRIISEVSTNTTAHMDTHACPCITCSSDKSLIMHHMPVKQCNNHSMWRGSSDGRKATRPPADANCEVPLSFHTYPPASSISKPVYCHTASWSVWFMCATAAVGPSSRCLRRWRCGPQLWSFVVDAMCLFQWRCPPWSLPLVHHGLSYISCQLQVRLV